jgi:glycosyltransferase EpsE
MKQTAEAPLVSVIIAAYNVEPYLDGCISSILNQSYSNYEILICEDCSTDNTRAVLKKYEDHPRIQIFYNDHNMRQAKSRNRCIEKCKGEFIMIQDADDIAEPERMQKLVAAFEEGISFVGSSCYCFDQDGKFRDMRGGKEYPQKKDLLWGVPFATPSMMFRKACLLEVGGYRISRETRRGEDYDLILRLYARGYRGKNISDFLYGYRLDRNTYARRTFWARLDECVIRYKGFKENQILFPWGWLWVFKPIPAYFWQFVTIIRARTHKKLASGR